MSAVKSLVKFMGPWGYRYFRMPWDIGPREELVTLVESGRIQPCRAIDLGSGTASNCVFLAQHGFDVTGVDLASSAIDLGHKRAAAAGVAVRFLVDDLTDLRQVQGTFDLLVDYGTLDDMRGGDRDAYVRNVLPLAHPGSLFLLFCFEWPARRWERLFPFGLALEPGEVQRRFGPYFEIERIAGTDRPDFSKVIAATSTYLMTRTGE
ncbi:MAG: methyltransferase domain-containing protein [Chloroflexota bacterium]